MSFNFDRLEQDVAGALHDAIGAAKQNEPALEQAAADALTMLGAPVVVTDGVKALLGGLLSHWTEQKAAADQAAADAAAAAAAEEVLPS